MCLSFLVLSLFLLLNKCRAQKDNKVKAIQSNIHKKENLVKTANKINDKWAKHKFNVNVRKYIDIIALLFVVILFNILAY